MSDYVYFRADSETMIDAISKFQKNHGKVNKTISVFMEKWGCTSGEYIRSFGSVTGIQLDEKPKGWIEVDHKYYRPHSKLRISKEVRDEFNSLPLIPTSDDLAKHLGLRTRVINGRKLLGVGLDEFNGAKVLAIPVDDDGYFDQPEGCVELRMSEYWKLKEEGKAA